MYTDQLDKIAASVERLSKTTQDQLKFIKQICQSIHELQSALIAIVEAGLDSVGEKISQNEHLQDKKDEEQETSEGKA